jgi:hypothetical protein
LPADDVTVDVLMQLHALVSKHHTDADAALDRFSDDTFAPSLTRTLETIPGVLVRTPGVAAHRALLKLVSTETEPATKIWLKGRLLEQAVLEASNAAVFDVADCHSLGTPLQREPRNEHELFEHVLSRLEEVKIGLEQGPFSERGLFYNGMPEKLLQLWLSARLRDAQCRRFSVHREEEVDDDKETDIQLSAGSWNVCVEIKPVDQSRSYSAASLTKTIREQLVGQYLKGFNSSHGILVLFRLDTKQWNIPGGGNNQSFQALVDYLQTQALLIKAEQTHVQELVVFAFDCVGPTGSVDNSTTT